MAPVCYKCPSLLLEKALPDGTEGLTGVLVDRYAIEREIGRGGMATVYLAQDLRHGSKVAVKVLHAELLPALGMARFTREIQVTARLQHPNILPVFDSGQVNGLPFYVTPYIEGESLAERIERERQLPVEDAVEIAREVADALAHAHAQGLVHRDIKPANILLAHGRAMVADFGIARLTEATSGEKLTQSGFALGTAPYMSPEQGAGDSVDGRSDIYSLGCVVYEMLAGQPPFSGISAQAVIARHLLDPVPSLRAVRPTVSAALDTAIRKSMAKVPADRFASAAQFREALRRASTGSRAVTPRRRYIRIAAIPIAALLLGGLVFAVSRVQQLHGRSDAAGKFDLERIAVLYFDDNSPKRDMGYLANGLTESLIRELSAVPALHVISRNGVKPYREHPVGLDSLVAALHVGSVVEGNVERSGDSVRVTVDLVDAATGSRLDGRTILHPSTDFFALEDDVAQQVANLLRTRLGEAIRLRAVQAGTTSVLARELLLRAEQVRDQAATVATQEHAGDAEDAISFLQRADSLLVQAESADPQWIQPVIARGWVTLDVAQLSRDTVRVRALQSALSHATRALRLAPRNPYALELHGTILWQLADDALGSSQDEEQLRVAEQDLRTAVAIQPTLASAWSTLSKLLRLRGALAEANVAAQRALTEDAYLENAPDILKQLFKSELLLGDYASAARSCERGRRSFPSDWHFVECRLALMLYDTSTAPNPRLARELVTKLESMDPQSKSVPGGQAYNRIFRRMVGAAVMARAGERDSARAVIAWARRETGNDPSSRIDLDYDEAYVRMALGEREAALGLLTEYLAVRRTLKPYIARDPLFAGLRNDERFKAMLQTPRA